MLSQGALLCGPPGTGKTLLAKAIAKTASAAFLNVNVAHIQSKWFGETPKLVEAVFSLARKVSPCVVFVDEVDGLLASRNDADMQHVNTMKTMALTTPYVVTASGLYYIGLCVVATTMPTLVHSAVSAAATSVAPIICGTSSTSLSGTAPDPAAAITSASSNFYAYVS